MTAFPEQNHKVERLPNAAGTPFKALLAPLRTTVGAGLTAIDRQYDPCDPQGLITCKEGYRGGDLLWFAGPAERDPLPCFFKERLIFHDLVDHPRDRKTRRNGIGSNTEAAKIARCGACQIGDASFSSIVRRVAPPATK